MKKIILQILFISVLLSGFLSCDSSDTSPRANIATNPSLIFPENGATLVLNPNLYTSNATTLKWSSLDFGYDASVVYSLQIIKATDDFSVSTVIPQSIPLGTFYENSNSVHEAGITTTILNGKLNALGATIGAVSSFKIRVFGKPAGQPDTALNGLKAFTQEIVLNSNVYDKIDEAAKLYVIGNFGSTSTYTDWDINLAGTSNSPLIYSPLNDGVYEGFVYMNVAAPQFKFANPTTTDLDIKGLKTQYTQTAITGVSVASPLGSLPGEILSTTDVSTGNVITPIATATGVGTYFIKADWTNNKYIAIKRLISLKGLMTSQQNKYLNYVTDPTSPYYRMYVATNVALSAGTGYIQLKDISSADPTKIERFGIDNSIADLQISPDATSSVKNKMKLGGATNFRLLVPGTYTVVLDLKNSANYNLRFIPN